MVLCGRRVGDSSLKMEQPPAKKAKKVEAVEEVKEKKEKKEKKASKEQEKPSAEKEETEKPEISYEERIKAINKISNPLASEKLTRKLHKLVKKAAAVKCMRRGVKEVIKALRKVFEPLAKIPVLFKLLNVIQNEKGLCVIAGDIYPIDVISHVPMYCEEKEVIQ